MRADHEQLFRHAAADHAGAAHPVFLGDHHFGAVAGGDAGGAHAPRTAPDDKQIDVELSHDQPHFPRVANSEWRMVSRPPRAFRSLLAIRHSPAQISLPRFFISARNWPLITSAKFCAHWFIKAML